MDTLPLAWQPAVLDVPCGELEAKLVGWCVAGDVITRPSPPTTALRMTSSCLGSLEPRVRQQPIAHALQHLREEVEAKGVPDDRGDLQDQLLRRSEFVEAIGDDVALLWGGCRGQRLQDTSSTSLARADRHSLGEANGEEESNGGTVVTSPNQLVLCCRLTSSLPRLPNNSECVRKPQGLVGVSMVTASSPVCSFNHGGLTYEPTSIQNQQQFHPRALLVLFQVGVGIEMQRIYSFSRS
jgi:hypothetical protein